ncbi:M20/M25/M40 family metallo-hydrolase [Polynucleobacter sp. AP-Melu-500A-A1]|uniref:M20/M25/M40 family metallo-hydrolase n=1 Tax=Polynucleobacter sp. AP-Melu-500A-A1 TaxID=2576929 RepID=UPI001C0B93ED|nr:M20/M25/M40 family metallo-hydrolase [Polynucleobacter sp. AP-Melu-500A-A1]MBU3631272.1 M20/M25/M40 family metallo-hydrolase [Polynucleobacter sp. AP-Melu-500A-A1]
MLRIKKHLALLVLGGLFLSSNHLLAQPTKLNQEQVVKFAQQSFPEYLQLLTIPSDAAVPADIQKTAEFIATAFQKRGFSTKLLENQGKPMVYAEFKKPVPGAKTILFYMHMDSQPVVPSEWAQADPWKPVIKSKNASGKWVEVPQDRIFAQSLDPELRFFGRSTSDDKGPIMMFMAAFDAMNALGIQPGINVKVIIDSEEEKGSPSIRTVVNANQQLLKSDGIVIFDGPVHASNRPTLIFGNRGNTRTTLTVYGPKAPLHSGHYGNYVPNPAMRLAQLLSSMKDENGKVLVAGYYNNISLSPEEKAILLETGDDEAAIRARVGIAKAETVGANYQEALQYPSLNIRGMAAASIGAKASNVIPYLATAELDLRTTPETPPAFLFGKVTEHIQKQGYHLIAGEPTDEERAKYDKLATYKMGTGGKAVRTPMNDPLGLWAFTAMKNSPQNAGKTPVRIRMMGGSVPTDSLVEGLAVPFVIMPLVNGDNNQHSFDENLRMGNYLDGIQTVVELVKAP